MDCDRVFWMLTAGPVASDAPPSRDVAARELDRHLRRCPSCRAIAHALRPCDGLSHEALPARERRGLPVFFEPAAALTGPRGDRTEGAERDSSSYAPGLSPSGPMAGVVASPRSAVMLRPAVGRLRAISPRVARIRGAVALAAAAVLLCGALAYLVV